MLRFLKDFKLIINNEIFKLMHKLKYHIKIKSKNEYKYIANEHYNYHF